jgi:hypothetical protein
MQTEQMALDGRVALDDRIIWPKRTKSRQLPGTPFRDSERHKSSMPAMRELNP